MLNAALAEHTPPDATIGSIMNAAPIIAYPDETLRELSYRMADRNVTRLPVVMRGDPAQIVGVVTVVDLLKGRLIDLQEERDTDRILHFRHVLPPGRGRLRVRSRSPPPKPSDCVLRRPPLSSLLSCRPFAFFSSIHTL